MKGYKKFHRILLFGGVIVAGLAVLAFLMNEGAAAQSTGVSGISSDTQTLLNLSNGLIARVSAVLPTEQKLGRDTTMMAAALADLQEVTSQTDSVGADIIEGNGTRKSPLITDFSERLSKTGSADSRAYRVALRGAYIQLKQIYDNFKAAYPGDFPTTASSTGLPNTGSSTVSSTATTTTTVSASSTVTATTTTTSTASTSGVALSTLNPVQKDNLALVNAALDLIARARGEINLANGKNLDTTQLQAAVADLDEIANFYQGNASDKIEGNGIRRKPIIIDFSERDNSRWMNGDSRDYRIALRDSYDQLKLILDNFMAANP